MGLSSKKQKQTTSQKETATTTPTVPDWITQPLQGYTGKVTDFLSKDPAQFVPGATALQEQAFAAAGNLGGQNQTFTDAIGMAKTAGAAPAATYTAPTLAGPSSVNLQGYDAPTVGGVTLGAANLAESESLLDGFDKYLDPSTQHLVDAALRNYDASTGKNAAALQAQQARTGAFGGSRAGIAQGEFAASSDRGRALTEAELRARAFSQAAQMADADAGRRQNTGFFNTGAMNTRDLTQAQYDLQRLMTQAGLDADAARFGADAANTGSMFNADNENQFALSQAGLDATAGQFNASAQEQAMERALQAAGLVGNLGAAQSGDARADLALTADLGEMQRAIEAAQLGAPLSQLQAAGQLYGMIPYGSYTGSNMTGTMNGTTTTKSKGSLFDMALAAASVAAAASDRRLKENIELVGELPDGLSIYEWDYRQDMGVDLPAGRFRGVMADEVAVKRPWAIGPQLPGGFATVNYSALEAAR